MAGQPRRIKSAADFGKVIDNYIRKNREDNKQDIKIPTDFDFCEFANISASTLDNYSRDTETYTGYLEQLKKLIRYREEFLLDLAVRNPKAASVAIFALKQKKNGGYEDRPTVQVEARELTIKTGDGMPKDSFS